MTSSMTPTFSAGFRLSHCGNNGAVPFIPKIKIELTFMALAIGGNPTKDVYTQANATKTTLRALDA